MTRLQCAAVCTLALGLPACLRLNPAFAVAGSDASSSGSTGASLDPIATGTTQASDSTTGGSSSSEPSSPSTTTTDTSGAGLTTTETTEANTTDAESGSTGTMMFRRAFLTSEVFGAQLGGIEGANAKCQAAADAAGLGGTYRAWISTPTSSPSTNFVQSSVPYVRVDGVQIADAWVHLIDGDLDAPLEVDEWGDVQNNGECGNVWTNTLRDGTPYDEDACTNWTSLTDGTKLGRSDLSNYTWTEACNQDCTKQYHLYCFEQ